MDMNKIVLGIETSGVLCSVAWMLQDRILLELNIEKPNIHATLLADLIAESFTKLKIERNDIGLVAVASGPGSFTGLRIGMSYAKGFCYGRNIPIIGVTNFEILAKQASLDITSVHTLIYAKHGRYYLGIFEDGVNLSKTKIVTSEQLPSILNKKYVVFLDNFFEENHDKIEQSSANIIKGKYSAALVCQIGMNKFNNRGADNLTTLEPFYLQSFAGVK
jgi:tRNA threonylcarbamoyladenosine biosynthesis protein TsaB